VTGLALEARRAAASSPALAAARRQPAAKANGLRPSQAGLEEKRCSCGANSGPTGECAECRAHAARRNAPGEAPTSPDLDPGILVAQASPMAGKVDRVSINVQPVRIADDDGKNPTAVPSLATAQTIWGKCCIDLKVAAAKTINKTSFKTMDEDPSSSTFSPSAEEQAAMTAAGAGGGTISVIVPVEFKDGANVGKNIDGGGVTYMPNKADATCFLVEGSEPSNVAHELGHAMGNGVHVAGTVMEGSGAYDKPNPAKVNQALCDTARKFAYGTASGKTDCTVSP
jgi:hypothetical protein